MMNKKNYTDNRKFIDVYFELDSDVQIIPLLHLNQLQLKLWIYI